MTSTYHRRSLSPIEWLTGVVLLVGAGLLAGKLLEGVAAFVTAVAGAAVWRGWLEWRCRKDGGFDAELRLGWALGVGAPVAATAMVVAFFAGVDGGAAVGFASVTGGIAGWFAGSVNWRQRQRRAKQPSRRPRRARS